MTNTTNGMDARLLRRQGFAIASRPRCGPVIWARSGRSYTETDALKIVDREIEAEKAEPKPELQSGKGKGSKR